jgi:hypothetical protein
MANPLYPVTVNADAWTKVATNVTSGLIHKKKTNIQYWQTYRLTGGAAPTEKNEAVLMFADNSLVERISSSSPIDIYVWVDEPGVLRIDL